MEQYERQALQYYDDDTQEYKEFVNKFKTKRTTDDCYTPEPVYNAVRDWVLEQCPEVRDMRIVRPFYPGGDYQSEDYEGAVVIDNPPFSILSEIKRFYIGHEVPFFLFAPEFTLFSSTNTNLYEKMTYIISGYRIEYHNGAKVPTGFVSNLFGDKCIIAAPDLHNAIKEAQEEQQKKQKKQKKQLRRYEYPKNLLTSARLSTMVKHGVGFSVDWDEVRYIQRLDCMSKGQRIFGGGMLVHKSIGELIAQRDEICKENKRKEARRKEARHKDEAIVLTLSPEEENICNNLKKRDDLAL